MPKKLRRWLKTGVPVVAGHIRTRHAIRLARSTKRLDRCLDYLRDVNETCTDFDLEGRVFLEVGAGYVLSHSLAAYVLGAVEVYCSDVSRLASIDAVRTSVMSSKGQVDWAGLECFGSVGRMKERYDRLLSLGEFSFRSLESLNIHYVAPIDLASTVFPKQVDVVLSASVLEHVPVDDVDSLLSSLGSILTPNGIMYHYIHLEDHEDSRLPFAFLEMSGKTYGRMLQTERGNRIRKSEWERYFSRIEDVDASIVFSVAREGDYVFPKTVDRSVKHTDEHDLRTAHLKVLVKKREQINVSSNTCTLDRS